VLHHISFNARREPRQVAQRLAQILGAHAIRAPHPPFPEGSWFVVYGDPQGTLIEVLPWGKVLHPEAAGGMRDDVEMRPYHGTHVLLGTSRSVDEVLSMARAHGWRAGLASAGLFSFIKVWVDDTFLVEVLTPEQAGDYVQAFNRDGLMTLDLRLRQIEASLAASARHPE
jgi:hypothetical protein